MVKHVLSQFNEDELDDLIATNYHLPMNNAWKSAPELLQRQIGMLREKRLPDGGRVDTVTAFSLRWKLLAESDKQLRSLSHRELRYVYNPTLSYSKGSSSKHHSIILE